MNARNESNNLTRRIQNTMSPYFVGMENDPFFSSMLKHFKEDFNGSTGFPPHNVIQTDRDQNEYAIELAVAGYDKNDLDVTLEERTLTIATTSQSVPDAEVKSVNNGVYLHKGISSKNFVKKFQLGEDIVVKNVTMNNGILTISLERIIPEEKKPKKLSID